MDLRQLRYFSVLSEELHFRTAAERLNITQPPLSLAIQSLERELGVQLFYRTQRKVMLTQIGEAFRQHADGILARLKAAEQDVRTMHGGEAGFLRVGFTAAASLLPFFSSAVHSFRESYPEVNLTLHEFPSQLQLKGLVNRELDVGLVRTPDIPKKSGISFTRLVEDPLYVAMHAGHPLLKNPSISIEDIKDQPLILHPIKQGVGIYDQVLRLFSSHGISPDVVQEAEEWCTIISLAASGMGVAVVPAELQCIKVPNIGFRPLTDEGAVTQLYLAARSGEESRLMTNFRTLAQTAIATTRAA